MTTFLALLLITAIIGGAYIYKKQNPGDIVVPAPSVKRTDLFYGYYGCVDDQVAETKDHINLFMESGFEGPDKAADHIMAAKLPTVLDVSNQIFAPPVGEFRSLYPDAEGKLVSFFTMLNTAGALKYVKFLYPIDEPNNTVGNVTELAAAVELVRKVAVRFAELDGFKLMVIYAAGKAYIGQNMYDIVGVDDYDKRSSILTGDYAKLKNSLLPGQKTVILPGGAGKWGQDPVPFVNFAQSNPEVAIVMPFIWFDNLNGGNDATAGIRSGPLKDAYIAAGKSII